MSRPFSNPSSWFSPPAHPGLSCHGLFLFFMGGNKASQRIRARSATKLQHNIQSSDANATKKNALERKMPRKLALVKLLLARRSRRPPDYSSNRCPPKTFLYDFLGGVWGLIPVVFLYKRPKTPLKKSYSKCLSRTQIR